MSSKSSLPVTGLRVTGRQEGPDVAEPVSKVRGVFNARCIAMQL